MSLEGQVGNRLIIQGQKLVAGHEAELTVTEWLDLYTEHGGSFQGMAAKRIREHAFKILAMYVAQKRKSQNAA